MIENEKTRLELKLLRDEKEEAEWHNARQNNSKDNK